MEKDPFYLESKHLLTDSMNIGGSGHKKCDEDETKPKDKQRVAEFIQGDNQKASKKLPRRGGNHFKHITNIVGQNEKSESGHPTPFYLQVQSENAKLPLSPMKMKCALVVALRPTPFSKTSQNILKPSNDTPILQT